MLLVLFDIDGTLLTSNGMGRASIKRALEQVCGRELSTDGVSFAGRTDPAIVRDILTNTGFSTERIDGLMERCLECYADLLESSLKPEQVTLLPGVRGLLDQFSSNPRTQLGLITGNLRPTAYTKLRAGGVADYFPFGAFGSDHEDRKRLPAFAVERASQYCDRHFEPRNTLIIGDTQHDISCSQFFGAHSVAVATGVVDYEVLEEAGPAILLRGLEEPKALFDLVESLLD